MAFSTMGCSSMLGTKGFERLGIHFLDDLQIVAAETRHFDVEIVVHETQLVLQRHKRIVLAQQAPQNISQLEHDDARLVGIVANQRRDRIQRIEQEMRIDLAG